MYMDKKEYKAKSMSIMLVIMFIIIVMFIVILGMYSRKVIDKNSTNNINNEVIYNELDSSE